MRLEKAFKDWHRLYNYKDYRFEGEEGGPIYLKDIVNNEEKAHWNWEKNIFVFLNPTLEEKANRIIFEVIQDCDGDYCLGSETEEEIEDIRNKILEIIK